MLTDEETVNLSFFAAIQLFRVPNFRNGIEELHRKAAEIVLSEIVASDKKEGKLPPEVEELYGRGGIHIGVESFVSLEPMITLARDGCTNLLSKCWHFAAPAEDMTFVTSDNPVFFQVPEEYRAMVGKDYGPLHPAVEVTFPLRKDLLLIFSPSFKYTQDQYNLLNCTTVCLDR